MNALGVIRLKQRSVCFLRLCPSVRQRQDCFDLSKRDLRRSRGYNGCREDSRQHQQCDEDREYSFQ